MSASGYVWRVTGTWATEYDDDYGHAPSCKVRHFMTERSAKRCAERWTAGREWQYGPGPDDDWPGYPPAAAVRIERSARIKWADR